VTSDRIVPCTGHVQHECLAPCAHDSTSTPKLPQKEHNNDVSVVEVMSGKCGIPFAALVATTESSHVLRRSGREDC
jgi:hypothetical protein